MRALVHSYAALVATLCVGCLSANKQAIEYRNKARERFNEGKFDLAVADYRKAKDLDKAGKVDGLEAERARAAQEQVKILLKDAWSKYDRGEFQQAHATLVTIQNDDQLSNKQTDQTVLHSLADAAAMAWTEVDDLRKRRFYLRAELLAQALVKPLPQGHPMRVRSDALKVSGIAFHLAKMRQLKTTFPAAAAFHYLVARRLGADSDPDGLELIAAVKRASGDATTYVAAAKGAPDWKQEDQLVLAHQLASTWDPAAITLFGTRYGMNDARYLDEVWNGTTTLEPYPPLAAIKPPDPDDVQVIVSNEPSSDAGPRYKSLDFWYAIGSHTLEKSALSTSAGGAFRFPSSSGKANYEASGFIESDSLGGKSSGYGADLIVTALAKAPLVLGAGIGYLSDEVPGDAAFPGTTLREKSVHIPIIARAPIGAGYVGSLEARINIYQFSKDKMPLPDGEQHFSPVTARIYGPIPLLADAVPALRALGLEAYATYTKDAPQELTFGGRLVYRTALTGGKSSSSDLWDKIEHSAFAIQTLAGPTWDFWFNLDTTPLAKDENMHGMGTLFRIPNKDSGSIYEFSLHFESENLGGNVGGWGIDYILMKPIAKLGVIGFGLGYLDNSISSPPAMAPADYKAPEQNSFHSPIVLRIPLGTAAIVGVEARLNYLALGGTGDPMLGEKRHFHMIGGRLWLPIPLLGDAISALSKFHLEGHISYEPGADRMGPQVGRTFNYGGMLIWRPIVTTKM